MSEGGLITKRNWANFTLVSSSVAGFAGSPSGTCSACSAGTWAGASNTLSTCSKCDASEATCDPKSGNSQTWLVDSGILQNLETNLSSLQFGGLRNK